VSWIQTFSRRRFELLEPDPDDILITDIARALSMQCRYVGHVDRFYSVAEHSVRLLWRAEDLGFTENEKRWALLHDAAEAYLGDVSRPLKQLPEMKPYRDAEATLMRAIATKFGLEGDEPERISQLDYEILGTEVDQLKFPAHPDWGKTTKLGKLPAVWPRRRDWSQLGWVPDVAESHFIREYERLFLGTAASRVSRSL
jgi:uncharacterized protein